MTDYKAIVRGVLVAAGAAALTAFLVLVRPADLSQEGAKTVIRIWHPWGGPTLEAYRHSAEAFEKSHPRIACELLYVPNDLANNQKFYTAVVGNCAPEVIFVDGPQVAEWAERGLLTDLGPLLKEFGRDSEKFKDEFFEPCWRQCEYKGRTWAITWCADPNFCFFWNKDAFRKAIAAGEIAPEYAGKIDPERAPATVAEMDLYNDAITKRQGDRLVRVGIVPWGVYSRANSLFTWGWAWGGEFYDVGHFKVTANHPRIVEALEWMCSYARKYDYRSVAALQSTFGSAEQNPFIVGKQVMQLLHIGGLEELRRYAPRLECGTAPLPQPQGGEKDSSWVGGWTVAIPSTLADPARRRAAMEYILWASASPEGTHLDVRTLGGYPGWKAAPFFEEAARDPRAAAFVEILKKCKHQRPVMPAQAFYMNELDRAVDRAVRGELTPQQALDEATRNTQAFLDKILSRHKEGT
jgi:multiple sugar transport system substrate-binding protein